MKKMVTLHENSGLPTDEWHIWLTGIGTHAEIVQIGDLHSGTVYDVATEWIAEMRDSEVHERVEWIEATVGYDDIKLLFARLFGKLIAEAQGEVRDLFMACVVNMATMHVMKIRDMDEEEIAWFESIGFECTDYDGQGEYHVEVA